MNNNIFCFCGSSITKKSLYNHKKTKKHNDFINFNINEITNNMIYLDDIKDTLSNCDYIEICNQLKNDYNQLKQL